MKKITITDQMHGCSLGLFTERIGHGGGTCTKLVHVEEEIDCKSLLLKYLLLKSLLLKSLLLKSLLLISSILS